MLLGLTNTGKAPKQLRVSATGCRLAVHMEHLLPGAKASCPAPSMVSCFLTHISSTRVSEQVRTRNSSWQENIRGYNKYRAESLSAALRAAWRSQLRLQLRARHNRLHPRRPVRDGWRY